MITDYGFKWGPLEVIRTLTYRDRRLLRIETGAHELEIVVSPQGNNIMVYMDGKKMEVVSDGD